MRKGKVKHIIGIALVFIMIFSVCIYSFAKEGLSKSSVSNSSILQGIIDSAADNDTIYLEAGTYEINNTLTIVGKTLTLVGAGSQETTLKITAQDTGRHFSTDSSLALENIVFDGAELGGGISSTDDVTVMNCIIKNCVSDTDGAGIYTADSVEISQTQFLNNETIHSSNAGALYTEHGGRITDSLFQENKASASGGAIVTKDLLTIDRSTFEKNEAAVSEVGDAGAIWGTVSVNQSTFTGNIKNQSPGLQASNTSYAGAVYGKDCTYTNTLFAENTAYGRGGAVAGTGNTTILNCVFDQNATLWKTDDDLAQSTVDAGALFSADSGTLSIKGSTFSNNSSFNKGGAIMTDMSQGTININNSTFVNNTAQGMPQYNPTAYGGGAIYFFRAGNVNISYSTIAENKAYRFGEFAESQYGGGLYLQTVSSIKIQYSIISGNTGGKSGSRDYANIGKYTASMPTGTDTLSLVDKDLANIFPGGQAVLSDNLVTAQQDLEPIYAGNPNDGSRQVIQTAKIKVDGLANNAVPADGLEDATDQRGFSRNQHGFRDLGAYELSTYISSENMAQSAFAGTAFEHTLDIAVKDETGAPVAGVGFDISVSSESDASAVLSEGPYKTNEQGVLSITATANQAAGSYTVSARPENTALYGDTSCDFALANTSIIVTQSGSAQSTTIGTVFDNPLELTVTDDQGTPIPGVEFKLPEGGNIGADQAWASLSERPYITDENGKISITATANLNAGTYTISLFAADSKYGTDPYRFVLTNAGAVITTAGNGQSTLINTPFEDQLEINVADHNGNPIAGVEFRMHPRSVNGPYAKLSEGPYITNSNGKISITATANGIAGNHIIAFYSVTPGYSNEDIVFTLTNAGTNISVSGNNQSALIGEVFAESLDIYVKDDHGTPIEGIEFTPFLMSSGVVLSEGPYITDSNGKISITATATGMAGTYTFSFIPKGSSRDQEELIFTLTNIGVNITASGSPQTVTVGKAFSDPLVISVKDDLGNPLEGVQFNCTSLPGEGASAVLSDGPYTTDSNGKISVTATANNTAGTYTISFTCANAIYSKDEYTFTLTNKEDTTASSNPEESSESSEEESGGSSEESKDQSDGSSSDNSDVSDETLESDTSSSPQDDTTSVDSSEISNGSNSKNPTTSQLSVAFIVAGLLLAVSVGIVLKARKKAE